MVIYGWYLTLFILMDYSVRFDTISLGWSIMHIWGCLVVVFRSVVLYCLKILCTFTNSVVPDKMLYYVALHCL